MHSGMQALDRLKARGIDMIAVVTMDTPFVMHAWAEQLGASEEFLFLSDVSGQLAKSLGTTFQAGPFGLRPTRYATSSRLQHSALLPSCAPPPPLPEGPAPLSACSKVEVCTTTKHLPVHDTIVHAFVASSPAGNTSLCVYAFCKFDTSRLLLGPCGRAKCMTA